MPAPRAFILGHPVAHSRSPMLHGYWLRRLGISGSYELADVPPEGLRAFLDGFPDRGFVGGNVTVPHKVAVCPFLARMDEEARAVGAVNTIWLEDGERVGGNTDAIGFMANLDERAPDWDGPAVLLGAGGAARAAVHALRQRQVTVRIANRTRENADALAFRFGAGVSAHGMEEVPDLLRDAGLVVNTTSLGMAGKPPLDLDLAPLRPDAVVYDIVYVPLETALLAQARGRRHRIVDGLGMLLHQAVPGFARWFGVVPTVTPELRALIEGDIAR